MFSSWCGKKGMQVHTDPACSPQSPLRVVPGFKTSFPIRIHWGIGQFCFCFLARNYLILKVLWEEQYQPYIPHGREKEGARDTFKRQLHKYTVKGETDHQPRLDAWGKCSALVHWEDPEEWDGEGGGRGIGMGNTCKSMADSCQCMAKTTTIL